MRRQPRIRTAALAITAMLVALLAVGVGAALLAVLIGALDRNGGCGQSAGAAASIVLGPPGTGQLVGATEYGGPGDPSSGVTGARGDNLLAHPDTYAELGGLSWQTATAMGGLQYMTPLRIKWSDRSAIAYKRDFGLGGGPVAGLPRVIDLWWQLAGHLGIPYENGLWSGPVTVSRPPDAGSGNVLGQSAAASPAGPAGTDMCDAADLANLPLTPGLRARLLPDGLAAAPQSAPAEVKEMIAAGNQIAGKPYVYGAAHGSPLSEVAPAYDCSSSVEHLLYGAALVPVTFDATSGQLESFGQAGIGQWVTLYADAEHVFMYVAGLRWDTHDAAGPGDGGAGIGWHPLIRSSDGFVARHPPGL